MTDYVLPPDLIASEVEWSMIDSTAVFTSPLNGAVRTYSRPANRWSVRLAFRNRGGAARSRLLALIAIMRGRSNRLWLCDPAYVLRGSFSCAELLTNNSAISATTGWTSSNAEVVVSSDSHQGLRLARTAVTANHYVAQAALTTVTSASYASRVLLAAGKGNVRLAQNAGTTAGASGLLAGTTRAAAGRYTDVFTASGTTSYSSFNDLYSGRSAGGFQFITHASVARCALVNGASQTGGSINIDNLPTSTNGLALAGDWVEINGELKRLTTDLNSDSAGAGYLMFEPTLRQSPSDNIPVIFRTPMGRFLFAEESTNWGTRAGILSDISLSLIEDAST